MAKRLSQIVRGGSLVAQPWPNGRGLTRDVVRRTAGDGRLDWLVSLADLAEDAPFSHFAGIDRIFTLVAGDQVDLVLDEGAALPCRTLVPAHFPGDRPTRAILRNGPGRALNVFVDRRRRRAAVAILLLAAEHPAWPGRETELLHCVAGRVGACGSALDPGDSLLGSGPEPVRALGGPAVALAVRIWDAPSGDAETRSGV